MLDKMNLKNNIRGNITFIQDEDMELEFPTDILFEIWKLCDILGKRSLALISKGLSERDQVRGFGQTIKHRARAPQPGNLICSEPLSKNYYVTGSTCAFLDDQIIGFIPYYTYLPCFVIVQNDRHRFEIRQWFREHKVYHVQEIPNKITKYSQMGLYFWSLCQTAQDDIKMMTWLWIYGLLKSIGEI